MKSQYAFTQACVPLGKRPFCKGERKTEASSGSRVARARSSSSNNEYSKC
jgi:hypothetical protein